MRKVYLSIYQLQDTTESYRDRARPGIQSVNDGIQQGIRGRLKFWETQLIVIGIALERGKRRLWLRVAYIRTTRSTSNAYLQYL